MAQRSKQLQSVGVIGGGAWGTALAQSLRKAGRDVLLWARDPEVVSGINERHRNDARLPGLALDPELRATATIAAAAASDFLLITVPAQQMRAVAALLQPHVDKQKTIVVCAKGYELGTGLSMSAVVLQSLEIMPAVLSGPSFASDVARGLPMAVALAAFDIQSANRLAAAIGHRNFRVYSTRDLVGVQMGGAVKNVLAIAAGIVAGRQLGASAQAALVTRAFHELFEFGRHVGAKRETLTGLSCLGDLILTCNSAQSRNFTLGRLLGEDRTLQEALAATSGTVEGIDTAAVLDGLVRREKLTIEMPIAAAVHRIISGAATIDDAIGELLSRPQRVES